METADGDETHQMAPTVNQGHDAGGASHGATGTAESSDSARGVNGTDSIASRNGRGGSGGGGFAALARALTQKSKDGQQSFDGGIFENMDRKPSITGGVSAEVGERHNNVDNLPLGSDAHSLTSAQANGIDSPSRTLAPSDGTTPTRAAAQSAMMGWQSFNSDSAHSSASLDMMLNERYMDPEEVLLSLGFGGGQPAAYVHSLARVPQRFLIHSSQARISGAAAARNGGECDGHPGTAEDSGVGGSGGGGGGFASAVQAMQQQQQSQQTSASSTPVAVAPTIQRKRTGFQTLVRTMSMMCNSSAAFPGRSHRASMVMGHHSHHHSGSGSPVCSPCHTPPTGGGGGGSCHGHPNSILHPVNQMYLASKGYYRQQGWPQGTYVESEEEQQEQAKEENQTDASSKRKMFQKTRSQRQNWSLCASGEKDANGTTGAADISSEPSPERQVENGHEPTEPGNRGRGVDDWFTRSMDDSLSQDEGARARVDSVGQNNTFFSTTTEESSTDSLDNAGSETERALEEIRRQYYEGQFGSVPSTDGETSVLTSSGGAARKESEDLFIPCRRAPLQKSQRSFSDTGDSTSGVFSEEGKEKHVGFRLGTGRRFQNGAAVDDDDDDDDDNNNNNAAVGVRMRVRGSEGDDEGPGGNLLLPDDLVQHSNNYFISPASSRQTTVEKSPTLPGSHEDDFPPHLSDEEGEKKNSHLEDDDNNNNNNNNNSDKAVVDENNGANLQDKTGGGEFADGQGDVKIIVSSFSSGNISPQCGRDTSCRADKTGNKLTVERAQQASSDSGSSSSGGTAVNSAMATEVELDTDATTPRNVLSEESDGVTDRDSISRTHSPYGFPPSRPDSGGRQRTNSQRGGSVTLSTSVSQTSEADFILAAQAEQGEAINATVRSSTAMSRAVSSGRRARGSSERDSGDSSSSGGTGGGRETGKRNGKVEDDAGNKVKLSALPPSINPLELMRRLRHSQDEFLRAGSVQSDSSGFGDADPTTDSGQFDTDQPKVQGSGSNHDSGESTLANSYNSSSQQQRQHQQHTVGDMSTQTSDSAMGTLSLAEEERLSTAQSPQSTKGNNFITTCFIPSLNRQEEDLRHRHVSRPSSSSSSLHHQQSRPQNLHQSQPDLHQPSPSHQLPGSLGRTPPYGYKSEISIYMPQDEATNPQPPYPYQRLQGTVPPPPPHHFPSPYPQGYSSWSHHQALAEEERYARQRRTSLGGRSVMSDSEWSRYGDFYHPLNYSQDSGSYNYGRYPGRFQGKSHSRRMSLDFYDSYEDDFDYMMHSDNERRRFSHADARERIRHSKNLRRHGQGHHRAQSQDEGQPRRYRSELELFTSGSGKLEQKQQQFERSQSEEGVLDDASPQPRNQVPLSEELAAASAGRMSPSYQVTITPAKSAPGLDASSDASKRESFSSDNRGSSRRVSSKIVIVPPSPTVTLTPATPEPTRHGTPTTSLSSKQIMGQDLPPLAGNLRNIPQSPVNTSMSDPIYHPLSTQVTPTSKATPSKPPVLVSSSSSSAAAAAAGFRSRKQRSCDILDDSYDGSFSEEGILSTPSHSGNSQNQSAAAPPTTFVSTVYHQTKGRFTSQQRPVSNSAPSSPLSERPPSLPGLNPRLVSPRHKHYSQRKFSSPRQTYQPNWPGFPPSPHGSHMPPSPLSQPFSPFRSASSSSSLPPYPYSHYGPEASAYLYSRFSEDYEGYYSSSVAESSSDFSLHSSPELGGRAEVSESRHLARLINQPVYFKGARRPGCHYRPRRLFKEWMLLGKRKRLQEENRLLQSALSRYKTELGVLETSLKADYAASADDMPPEERQKMEDLEWLWSEVRTQVQEMENLLLARIKSVQSGNNFHMLLANLGVINKITDLIKEQTYQQQVVTSRMEDADDEDDDEEGNDADNMMNEDEDEPELEFDDSADEVAMYEEDYLMDRMGSSRGSNHSYHGPPRRNNRSYHGRPHSQKIYPGRTSEIGTASTARYGPSSRSRFKQRWPSGFKGQVRNSFSTSNLAREDLNASLEQVKSSLLSQVHREIEENTRRLQYDLEAKTKEIEELKKQMGSRTFSPEVTYRGASAGSISSAVRADQGQGRQTHKRALSRSRVVGDRIVQETDV